MGISKGRSCSVRMSKNAEKEIKFRKVIKNLEDTRESLQSVIEEESLEVGHDVQQLLGDKIKKRAIKRKPRSSDSGSGSSDEEVLAYKELLASRERDSSNKKVDIYPTQEEALASRLEDICTEFNFVDTQIVNSNKAVNLEDFDNDAKRESAFQSLASEAVILGKKLCKKHNIPFKRPNDYYAEMIKDDSQMEKIRSNIVSEVARIEKFEKNKKMKMSTKFGKKVKAQKLAQRQAQKSSTAKSVTDTKKKRNIHDILSTHKKVNRGKSNRGKRAHSKR